MASRTAIAFVDTDNMLKFFGEKLNDLIEDFKANEVWLKEIQEEATKMFIWFSRSRRSLRRSSVRRPKLLNRIFVENNGNYKSRTEQACPVHLSQSESPSRATMANLETEQHNIVPVNRVPLIELSLNDCKPPELQTNHVANLAQSFQISEDVNLFQETVKAKQPECETILETAVNPSSSNPEAMKLKIDVTAKVNPLTGDTHLANWELSDTPIADGGSNSGEVENELVRNHNRRSVRKSISSRRSSCFRLMDKLSLNVQRTTVVQESSRKSSHKSIAWRKNMQESSTSSYHNSIQKLKKNMEEECVEVTEPNQNQPVTLGPEKQGPRCTRNAAKIVKADLENVSRLQACRNSPSFREKVCDSSNSDELNSDNQRLGQGAENVHNHAGVLNCDDSLPRKKTASPSCPPSKEKEKICLKNLKKEVRIQRREEEKKRQLEELKKRRHLRCVLETRSRVDQQEEKKRKAEQKNSQIDEKMHEKCLAEERAKKKAPPRKEEAKSRRPQEEAQKQKLQEEKHQELLQQKEEKQHKMAEARKLQEQQPAELEKAKLHELQLTTDRQWEREREQEHTQTDKECEHLEKDKAMQQKLEQTTPEDAALLAEQELGQLHEATQDTQSKLEEQQLEELGSLTLANEETSLKLEPKQQENESRLCEDQRKCKEEKNLKVKEEVSNKNILNVTIDVHHSAVLESYTMTPNGYSKIKLSKVDLETYGMDLQSDDSTDDEGAPRKPIPTWANGTQLQQALVKQYYHPLDLDKFFGVIQPPNLENIFGKSKPRYLKRTSSAVWHSPPASNSIRNVPYGFMKY